MTVTLGVPKVNPEISAHYALFLSGRTLRGSLFGGWRPKSDLHSLVDMYMRKVRTTINLAVDFSLNFLTLFVIVPCIDFCLSKLHSNYTHPIGQTARNALGCPGNKDYAKPSFNIAFCFSFS